MNRCLKLIAPAIAVGIVLILPPPASSDSCVGNSCGALLAGWHCHSVNSAGVQCWDKQDNSCEDISGFSTSQGARSCSVGGGFISGTQTVTAIGAINVFQSQIQIRAVPRVQADAEAGVSGAHFGQLTTSLEQEDWDLGGFQGDTLGLRLGYTRQGETGRIFGFAGSYQEAEPDAGDTTELLSANFTFGHTLGDLWKWGVSGTVSDISDFATLFGGSVHLAFNNYLDNGAVLSGGIVGQFQTADELDDEVATAGVGIAYGLPIGQRFALDLDAYWVSVIEPELTDDSFFTLGGTFSYYLSPRLGLTLGYKILEGIDDLDSSTITLGASTRWQ